VPAGIQYRRRELNPGLYSENPTINLPNNGNGQNQTYNATED